MTTARPARRRRASRGDGEQLRAEIIAATRELVASVGSTDDVSIRAVATKVGVTSPSIYLHFADKAELMSAVVVDVFRELDDEMLAAADGETEPLGRLRAFGLAYVRFARAHPEHYRLAVMDVGEARDEALDETIATSAFAHMHEAVIGCITAGVLDGDPLAVTFELWAAAHGVASLLIAKPYLPWGDIDDFADRVLCGAVIGIGMRNLLTVDDVRPTHVEVEALLADERRRLARRRSSAKRPADAAD